MNHENLLIDLWTVEMIIHKYQKATGYCYSVFRPEWKPNAGAMKTKTSLKR